MVQPAAGKMSPAEYLAAERTAALRHEFVAGELFAMAGGTYEHNVIAGNVITELNLALRDRPCVVFPSDMKVLVEAGPRYHYPHASVVCGERRFEDDMRDVLLNPTLVVEVLSDSTERYDRGDKFASYRLLPSLTDYVLLSSKQAHAEHFVREADGSWRMRVYGPGEQVRVTSLDVQVGVDDLYRKVFSGAAGSRGVG